MNFWKKVLKKYKKEKDKDPNHLLENKYFQKLHNKLNKQDTKHKKHKK
jgi:hypothetical protein